MAKNQIDPEENILLRHSTQRYHIKCLKIFCTKSTFNPKSLIKFIQSVYTWNYFGADFNETNALFEKLPLTNATIRHSLPYPGISFDTPLISLENSKKIASLILMKHLWYI